MENTYRNDLKKRLRNPAFQRAWIESEIKYILAQKLIEKRLSKNLSQRQLAQKVKTSQAVICRIETMQANPSINLLKRIATALELELTLQFK